MSKDIAYYLSLSLVSNMAVGIGGSVSEGLRIDDRVVVTRPRAPCHSVTPRYGGVLYRSAKTRVIVGDTVVELVPTEEYLPYLTQWKLLDLILVRPNSTS